jgi:molybdate transport system ATP-binding protein
VARQLRRPARARGPHVEFIELRNVGVRFGRHWALRDVSFTLEAGQRWLVTGANGAGKTVLLKLLRGELWPTPTGREQRRYRIGRRTDDEPLDARARIAYLGPERQDKYERREWNLTVEEVVGTGLFDTDIPLDKIDARGHRAVHAALEQARLAGLARRRFLSLSYGQRRRVLLARALVRRPDVLLLDEALNGLDASSRKAFLGHLHRASDDRMAWVLTTHRERDRPADVTHVAQLSEGRVVVAGPLAACDASRTAAHPRTSALRGRVARGPDLVQIRNANIFRDGSPVISRLDWTLRAGEHWCVTGPNGSGKSTFIALLYGDLWPADGGSIERGRARTGTPIESWKRGVGLVSPELQARYAATECTLEEIVVSGLHSSIGLNEPPTARELARARAALRRLGLEELGARRARQVSYGQLRLALFARALVRPRRLLLLDEPFDGLDAAKVVRVRRELEDAVRRGTQLVVASHHEEDVPGHALHVLEFGRGGRWRVTSRDAARGNEGAPRVRRGRRTTA